MDASTEAELARPTSTVPARRCSCTQLGSDWIGEDAEYLYVEFLRGRVRDVSSDRPRPRLM